VSKEEVSMSNILIIGAGEAGRLLINELNKNSENRVIGFIDDKKKGTIEKTEIIGKIKDLPSILEVYAVDQIIVAMPSQKGKVIRKILSYLVEINTVKLSILPELPMILNAKVDLGTIRPIEPSDLVGESIVKSEQEN
jgi:FlaA1/EpsC-like NDP-sugar epimerase